MPGASGAGGGKKSKGKTPKQAGRKAKKGRSGNPAKRAAQEAGQPATTGADAATMTPPDLSDLPDDLKKLLS